MQGPRSLLAALMLAAAALAGSVGPWATPPQAAAAPVGPPYGAPVPAAAPDATPDPLAVTIDDLSPAVVPAHGPITVSGTVTNTTEETWDDVTVYPLTSRGAPMTTQAELAAAVAANPDLPVGERILAAGVAVGSLEPGQQVSYDLRVPRGELGIVGTPGVYWFGVHALGANGEGRDFNADGKARTFMPLIDPGAGVEEVALALQVRHRIAYNSDGTIANPERWSADLAPGGALDAVLKVASDSTAPLSIVFDPAILGVANTLAAGDQARVVVGLAGDETTEPTPTTPSVSPGTAGEPLPDSGQGDPLARAWLEHFRRASVGRQLLALPYADVDASAATRHDPDLLARAREASATAVTALGFEADPVIASPNGYLNPATIGDAGDDETVIISSRALGREGSSQAEIGGRSVIVSSSSATEGGPGPDDPLTETALRQRIVSEAAVRLLTGGGDPLVVMLPARWQPSGDGELLDDLDLDWLRLRTLDDLEPSPEPPHLGLDDLVYPEYQAEREVGEENFRSAQTLIDTGRLLLGILPPNSSIEAAVTSEAYAEVSYWTRDDRLAARESALRSAEQIRSNLDAITLETSPSLTLSSDSGPFPAAIHNGLDVPITVSIGADSDAGVRIEGMETMTVAPDDTVVARLKASASRLGVHNVTLFLTTPDGRRLPVQTTFPVRTSQISDLIWQLMGLGVGLLALAVVYRVWQRIRSGGRGARQEDGDDAVPAAPPRLPGDGSEGPPGDE